MRVSLTTCLSVGKADLHYWENITGTVNCTFTVMPCNVPGSKRVLFTACIAD